MKSNQAMLALIKRSGKSVSEVAGEMGLDRQRVYQFLCYPNKMRLEQAVELASIIKVKPIKLIRQIIYI